MSSARRHARPNTAGLVVVDTAGGQTGGARRFRDELESNLPGRRAVLIGAHRRVDATWLFRREVVVARHRPRKVVATNNAAFTAARCESWVLLRNALNFLSPAEQRQLRVRPRPDVESVIMRVISRRADVVVVPSSDMAERVTARIPSLTGRLVVRPHPVTPRGDDLGGRVAHSVMCPVMFDPHKDMASRVRKLVAAADLVTQQVPALKVFITAERAELAAGGIQSTDVVVPIGRLTTSDLARHLSTAQAIFFPPVLESFGYPLAEARANGQRVVARNTAHNREIAGPFLTGYDEESVEELAAALQTAVSQPAPVEATNPFDPHRYFDWLLTPST